MREESRFLAFSGIRVHFAVAYPDVPVKNRVLMLSSPLINTFHWRKLLPELTDLGCLCVTADLPGFGLSDTLAPQSDVQRANIVWGILDDIDETTGSPLSMWHLMGHGLACSALLQMAAQNPDSVKSQVHLSPLFTVRLRDPLRWYDAHIPNAAAFHSLVERWASYPMDDYIVDRMRRPFTRPGARQTFERMIRFAAQPPKYGMGFCPTMALLGGRDPLMTDGALKHIHALLKDAETHTIQSAGHFPMETHSRALRDYLRGWMKYNA